MKFPSTLVFAFAVTALAVANPPGPGGPGPNPGLGPSPPGGSGPSPNPPGGNGPSPNPPARGPGNGPSPNPPGGNGPNPSPSPSPSNPGPPASTPSLSSPRHPLTCSQSHNAHCGARGTLAKPAAIGKETGLTSLNACRDVCMSHKPCKSFDWDQAGGTCIQYSRPLAQMGFKKNNKQSGQLYNRSCFHCTSRHKPKPKPPASNGAPATCDNEGLTYAIYHNPFGDNTGSDYPNFNPSFFQTAKPDNTAVTTTVGGFNAYTSPMSVYGGTYQFPSQYFVVNHRGYMYIPAAGNYILTTGYAGNIIDDSMFFWTGENALHGYSRDNALVDATYYNHYGEGTTVFTAPKGYLPFRILYVNGQRNAGLSISISDPKGNVILQTGQQTTALGNYVVQKGCGKTTSANAFPAWGQES